MTFSWTVTIWNDDVSPIDHVESGIDRLGWQYKNSSRIESLLTAFLNETDDLELVARAMVAQRWPYTAEGVNLDNIGKIIVYDRVSGMTDDEYRLFCLAKIFANKSECYPGDIIEILSLLNITGLKKYREIFPAEIQIQVTECPYIETSFLILGFIQPGGVMLDFVYNSNAYDDTLQFSDTLSTVKTSSNHGLSWSQDTSFGGKASGVFRS